MMCQPKGAFILKGLPGCCCDSASQFRHFFSSKEEKECLDSYKDQLEKELAGVEERIKELEKK
jgi:hypothetical protein